MNQKGFANLVLVGVIVILLVVGGYFFWHNNRPYSFEEMNPVIIHSTSNETANWKTYTDTKNGFEFKYPDDPSYVLLVDAPHGVCEGVDAKDIINQNWTVGLITASHVSCNDVNFTMEWLMFAYKGHNFDISVNKQVSDTTIPAVFRQILSTFKFTN